MIFFIQYAEEYSRVIAAIVLESREIIRLIAGKGGFEVYDYFNEEIDKVTDGIVPYKIESETGSLVAYFSVKVTGNAGQLYQTFIRPNFQQFADDINQKIAIFIFNGYWKQDFLQGELL